MCQILTQNIYLYLEHHAVTVFFVIGEATDVDTIFRLKKEEDKKKNEVSTSFTHRNSSLLVQGMNLNRLVNNITKSSFDPLGSILTKAQLSKLYAFTCAKSWFMYSQHKEAYI